MQQNTFTSLWITGLCLALCVIVPMGSINFNPRAADEGYRQCYQQANEIYNTPLPDSLDFCGEPVPLDYFLVHERLDRELSLNVYWQSNMMLLIKRAYRFFPTIEKILSEEGLPNDFKYLCLVESALINVPSSAGAAGVWHFLQATGRQYGLEVNDEVDERYNVEKSTRAACTFLKDARQRLGSWALAAAAFNAGMGGVSRHMEQQDIRDYYKLHLPDETMRYVFRILAMKLVFENPQAYGFFLRKKDLYPPVPVRILSVDTTINDLFAFARSQKITYQQLKQQNVWLRSNKLPNKSKKTYWIEIPIVDSLTMNKLFPDTPESNALI